MDNLSKILLCFFIFIMFICFFKMTKSYGHTYNNSITEYENPLLLPQFRQQQEPNVNMKTHMPEMPQINIQSIIHDLPKMNQQQFMYPVLDGVNNDYKNTILKMKGMF